MPMFPPNADPAYRRHFSENIKPHLPLPMIGNEFVKVYTRCRYWPRCSNRKCKFVHPVYDCKFDKDCPYDTLCAFRHSSDPVPDNLTGYYRGRRKSKPFAINTNSKLATSNIEGINVWAGPETGIEPTPEIKVVDNDASLKAPPPTPNPSPKLNPLLQPPKIKKVESKKTESKSDARTSTATPTVVKMESVSLAYMFQDYELPRWPIERNIYASPFPNTVFLSNLLAQKRPTISSSLNFEDCGELMSWTRSEENTTLGPRLTVAAMKKIWQDIPNSYSRHELAR
ncbi:hypothetical protein BGW37DRAFT_544780 [Umbelopsis sp. PMI_123]|nr:hypothetical protein BGW37DRAFT_544780 [Umbelopsis sp. PMI_123]